MMAGVLVRVNVEISDLSQVEPERAQILTVGESAGSKVPETLGLGCIGDRKKKCGLAPPWAPSEIRKLGDSPCAAGPLGSWASLQAAEPRRAKRTKWPGAGILEYMPYLQPGSCPQGRSTDAPAGEQNGIVDGGHDSRSSSGPGYLPVIPA
jgi:hypothetical protein